MMGVGPSFQGKQRVQVYCLEFREDMVLGSLAVHLHTHKGEAKLGWRHWGTTAPNEEPHIYKMAFLIAGYLRNCPIKGCWGWAATWVAMRFHLYHWHIWDTILILEEGNLPHPLCPRCEILVLWRVLNEWNIATSQCAKGAERDNRQMAEEDIWESVERVSQAYGRPLEMVTSLKYLGRVLTVVDDELQRLWNCSVSFI